MKILTSTKYNEIIEKLEFFKTENSIYKRKIDELITKNLQLNDDLKNKWVEITDLKLQIKKCNSIIEEETKTRINLEKEKNKKTTKKVVKKESK